ncbi:gamma-glutamylcyclotransferase family protein [Dyadobacter sp.]|uniref:gamma-glutamylcyclotransferase family protein n=1 Tax=Dyadobacter sp. TaxID=1914288 RepID=UPI003F708327
MLIFSYGSNMSTNRLKDRVPSAQFSAIGKVMGHQLRLQKISKKDGSAKADCFETGITTDEVWGVIFEIDDSEKKELDKAEGLGNGYNQKSVKVLVDKAEIAALVYYADYESINPNLMPYNWYLAHILAGANEHNLPADYIKLLQEIPFEHDPDSIRESTELSIYRIKNTEY